MASNMTEKDVERIAASAAEKAVQEVLLRLGIDSTNVLEVQRDFAHVRNMRELFDSPEFEADLAHLRRWRKTVEGVGKQSLFTSMAVITTGFFGLLWLAFETYIRR